MQNQLEQLAKLFLKFPGIGQRQAKRFAYFILTQPESYARTLAQALTTARSLSATCSKCLRIYEGTNGVCSICSDTSRDSSALLVVEKSQDIESLLQTDYRGLFFVLGGLIPIVQKTVLGDTNIALLKERIAKESAQPYEVILAFPVTPNGEHTDSVVREMLAAYPVSITSLGRGLSTGAELEYADLASLNASLKKRE
ncbi:recombination protein RecR [Candidatus Nomurabacteria bacterium]|nr:recombination protein RecR [Candidatus Nomurabacteria bacterium]